MPNPAGVKKRGIHSAFNPRTPGLNYATEVKIFKRQRKAVYRALKGKEREKRAIMDLFTDFSRLEQALDSKNSRRVYPTARNLMAGIEEYMEDISQKKIGEIKLAMVSKTDYSEAKLNKLEKFYRGFLVDELGEGYVHDPGMFQKLMKGGVVPQDNFEEDYIVPAIILDRFKTFRDGDPYLRNRIEPMEKKFMDDAFKWFLARTPSSVYELRDGAPLPSWYLTDLYQAMNEYASKLAR